MIFFTLSCWYAALVVLSTIFLCQTHPSLSCWATEQCIGCGQSETEHSFLVTFATGCCSMFSLSRCATCRRAQLWHAMHTHEESSRVGATDCRAWNTEPPRDVPWNQRGASFLEHRLHGPHGPSWCTTLFLPHDAPMHKWTNRYWAASLSNSAAHWLHSFLGISSDFFFSSFSSCVGVYLSLSLSLSLSSVCCTCVCQRSFFPYSVTTLVHYYYYYLYYTLYSAFRQKFPKLWTSVAHSFLQQIAQNKNWAHLKATTLPRICKVEMQQASLLFYSAIPQSGGILGCALVCPTSLYVRTIRFPTFCRSLPSVGAYSQYHAWSGCRRSADVPRADHDRVGSSPWQGGFKERVYCACLPSICLIFSTCKYAATAFNFEHKKTINVTDLSWPKHFVIAFNDPKPAGYATPKLKLRP